MEDLHPPGCKESASASKCALPGAQEKGPTLSDEALSGFAAIGQPGKPPIGTVLESGISQWHPFLSLRF